MLSKYVIHVKMKGHVSIRAYCFQEETEMILMMEHFNQSASNGLLHLDSIEVYERENKNLNMINHIVF